MLVPRTSDGRVVFLIPWHGCTLIGTTDTPVSEPLLEPRALPSEIDFLLKTASAYLERAPQRQDVRSLFAGVRPLVRSRRHGGTSRMARSHLVETTASGLITIAGGKWTTYRQMAADCVDQAAVCGGLKPRSCITRELPVHGHNSGNIREGPFADYGSDAEQVAAAAPSPTVECERLHPDLPCHPNEVVWAVRQEMARTVEDVLSRRTRGLLLNARAACEIAPRVAELMAHEMQKDREWQAQQVSAFRATAKGYLLSDT